MADKILTLSGTGDASAAPACAPCPSCPPTHLTVVKKQRYPHGRHCVAIKVGESGACRCSSWKDGRGGKRVTELCREAGHGFKIGPKKLRTKE